MKIGITVNGAEIRTWVSLISVALTISVFFMGCELENKQAQLPALASMELPAAQPGRWFIPEEDLMSGNSAMVPVTEAGPWNNGENCSPYFTEGAKQLKQWVLDNWPGVTRVGGYNCRKIAGTMSTSIHGVGRALDIHFDEDMGQADNDLGDALANYFVRHAEAIGVQRIIWDQSIWTAGRGVQARQYGGVSPHTDHIHMELSVPAGNLETEFFRNGLPAPNRPACGMPLPPAGATIDNSDDCFQSLGNSEYWRPVNNAGIGGSLIWTNAFESERPGNWAQWRFTLSTPGQYEVEVHSVKEYSKYDAVRYEVRTPTGPQEVIADLKDYDGWYSLGVFEFDTADEYSVAVFDNYSGMVESDLHITADAVRLIGSAEPAVPTDPVDPDPREPIPAMGGQPTQAPDPSEPDVVEDPRMEMPMVPDETMDRDDSMNPGLAISDSAPNGRGPQEPKKITRVYYEAGCASHGGRSSPTALALVWGLFIALGYGRRRSRV